MTTNPAPPATAAATNAVNTNAETWETCHGGTGNQRHRPIKFRYAGVEVRCPLCLAYQALNKFSDEIKDMTNRYDHELDEVMMDTLRGLGYGE